MKQFNVTGMSCAACSARVEKAVGKVPGVTACSVSLLTNSMGVEGNIDENEIIKAVVDAGYGATVKGGVASSQSNGDALKRRLIASMGFLVILMYFSMGHMVGLPLPGWYHQNAMTAALLQFLLTLPAVYLNRVY